MPGDEPDFQQIVEQYQHRVFCLVCSILGPGRADDEAEDVMQDVFLKVYQRWSAKGADERRHSTAELAHPSGGAPLPAPVLGGFAKSHFREESALGTWIYSIARNQALDRRRLARNRWQRVDITPERAVTEPHTQRELELAQAIERLPETYQTILRLYYWQQQSLTEISTLTGIKEGTVKSYLARARQNLETILEHSEK